MDGGRRCGHGHRGSSSCQLSNCQAHPHLRGFHDCIYIFLLLFCNPKFFILFFLQRRIRTISLVLREEETETEEERLVREMQEGRAKQLRVALQRLESPRKPDGGLGRAVDRRTLAKQEEEERRRKERQEEKQEQVEKAQSALPPCPVCSATFSTKANLIRHIRYHFIFLKKLHINYCFFFIWF